VSTLISFPGYPAGARNVEKSGRQPFFDDAQKSGINKRAVGPAISVFRWIRSTEKVFLANFGAKG
jgi:hypothetical protein